MAIKPYCLPDLRGLAERFENEFGGSFQVSYPQEAVLQLGGISASFWKPLGNFFKAHGHFRQQADISAADRKGAATGRSGHIARWTSVTLVKLSATTERKPRTGL